MCRTNRQLATEGGLLARRARCGTLGTAPRRMAKGRSGCDVNFGLVNVPAGTMPPLSSRQWPEDRFTQILGQTYSFVSASSMGGGAVHFFFLFFFFFFLSSLVAARERGVGPIPGTLVEACAAAPDGRFR